MEQNRTVYKKILQIFPGGLVLLIFLLLTIFAGNTYAERADELKNEISDKNEEIKNIEREIELYQAQINKTLEEADSLNNAIKQLDISRKKLNSDIYLTEKKIEVSSLNIEQLAIEISSKKNGVNISREALAEIIRNTNETDSQSLVEIILANDKLSDFFDELEYLDNFHESISANLQELIELKKALEEEKEKERLERQNLENLRTKLIDQKILVDINSSKKQNLLKETKNREANYRKIVSDRLTKKEELEKEITKLEDELRIEIDPSSLPQSGSGVLGYPLARISLKSCWDGGGGAKNCVTQFFGNTDFSTSNPQVYKGSGHRGMDFRASIGTPVLASENGVVRFVYHNTPCVDAYYGGKWILIDHPNNLSTLYAHLSLIKVSAGQNIKRGQLIGYSGDTGYTTGPHLHFTVLASKAVRVTGENGEPPYINKYCGKELKIPIAPNNGYLNPLSYL